MITATDKLINSSQGDSIITALNTIAQKSNTPYNPANLLPSDYVTDVNNTHKFATASQLDQIETNKSNILLIADQSTPYNLADCALAKLQSYREYNVADPVWNANVLSNNNKSFTVNGDGTITVTGTAGTNTARMTVYEGDISAGSFIKGCPTGGALSGRYLMAVYNSSGQSQAIDIGNGAVVNNNLADAYIQIAVPATVAIDSKVFKPMLIPKSAYDAGFTDYQPYALPNTTITPALQECVDNGVKNLVSVPDITISASGGGYVTANNNVVLPAGKYVIIFNATATSGNLLTSFKDSGGNTIGSLELAMNGGQIKGTIFLSAQSSYFNAFANQPTTVTKYMIITEAMYDAGFTNYQPHALSNVELTEESKSINNRFVVLSTGSTNVLSTTFDLSVLENGIYIVICTMAKTQSTRYGVSAYLFRKATSEIDLFTPISEVTKAKINSISVSGTTATMTFDASGYHTVRCIRF